ncbi:MAG: acyl-CoA dehydrogenase family protein [Pseudomonadales bacterium]|jgi:alkylation response protein AidB-like acyl-CoA dehydrogenase|nr:acyl-CoA dehydrogenase family protein [Pseudomonadales bacterium]MDP6315317.1 acyl-CoA dehydrogenase family protein [Pseudomonadales bacterium]MDP7314765.1 acyl-CoA dehydrogenase family protein [Pseudomonadales bacterium]MDP7577195.1 acyl-CoA dehydrogenase family protein [Pseudomonadales bacterium]HJP52927.1 acyl-CoA dehydrogenase family protein [Pseudomonadales bacterium]|tara:strand:- start:175 stop:1380 length:1206 start_codon:yes stop_codon:yes gene_type:complete
MDFKEDNDTIEFRKEVQKFLDDKLTPDLRKASRLTAGTYTDISACLSWHRILAEKGWIAPGWPEEYGGTGWNDLQRHIFGVECYKADAPLLFNMGIRHIGPVLMAHGTKQQRDYYLPRILSGADIWCQGYSEPTAGSDLAALNLQAVRKGDEYILNGTKLWTTGAHFAHQIFCLVRTSNEGKKQAGITFLVMSMETPGLSVEPILSLNGQHECNQVFFDNVRVPVTNRVGEENDGWRVAKVLMQFARSNNINMAWVREGLQRVKEGARIESNGRGGCLLDDQDFLYKLSTTEIRLLGVESLELRLLSEMNKKANPGFMSSVLKSRASELIQEVSELMIEVVAWYGFPFQIEALDPFSDSAFVGPEYALPVACLYLNQRSTTIASGSSEIQRDVLAKRVLGL